MIENKTNLVIENLGDLGITVESALPVVERSSADAVTGIVVAVGHDPEAELKGIVRRASPDQLLKVTNEGLGGGFLLGLPDCGRLPVGREEGESIRGWRFQLVLCPSRHGVR